MLYIYININANTRAHTHTPMYAHMYNIHIVAYLVVSWCVNFAQVLVPLYTVLLLAGDAFPRWAVCSQRPLKWPVSRPARPTCDDGSARVGVLCARNKTWK